MGAGEEQTFQPVQVRQNVGELWHGEKEATTFFAGWVVVVVMILPAWVIRRRVDFGGGGGLSGFHHYHDFTSKPHRERPS